MFCSTYVWGYTKRIDESSMPRKKCSMRPRKSDMQLENLQNLTTDRNVRVVIYWKKKLYFLKNCIFFCKNDMIFIMMRIKLCCLLQWCVPGLSYGYF